jgi:hypothetical protein
LPLNDWYNPTCDIYEIQISQNFKQEVQRTLCWTVGASVSGNSGNVEGTINGGVESCSTWTNPAQSLIWRLRVEPADGNCVSGGGGSGNSVASACFSGTSTVQVLGKGPVALNDLRINDKVLTDGTAYEPVYAFGHRNAYERVKFLQIFTSNSNESPLEITAKHLLFLAGKANPVTAESIQVGDALRTAHSNNAVGTSTVTKIVTVEKEGVYAPLTASGNLVVEGIVASAYVALQETDHEDFVFAGGLRIAHSTLVHWYLAPFRFMCMRGAASLSSICHFYNADGMPFYIGLCIWLTTWTGQTSMLLQLLCFAIALPIVGTFMALELLVGASLGPFAAFVAVTAALGLGKNVRKSKGNKRLG